jgi:hypothetical protein
VARAAKADRTSRLPSRLPSTPGAGHDQADERRTGVWAVVSELQRVEREMLGSWLELLIEFKQARRPRPPFDLLCTRGGAAPWDRGAHFCEGPSETFACCGSWEGARDWAGPVVPWLIGQFPFDG